MLAGICHNGAFHHLDSAALQKSGRRPNADRQHNHIRRQGAGIGLHTGYPGLALQAAQCGAGQHPHPFLNKLPANVIRHLRVKNVGHQLVGHIHHGHIQPAGLQVFGCF